MQMIIATPTTRSYQRSIAASKKARWTIEDVLCDRRLVGDQKFLPDGLSLVASVDFLSENERRLASRVQGRTYANLFGLVERYINTLVLDLARSHAFDDQFAVEALVRFSDEELKHQELFRRVELLCAEAMPLGYHFIPTPNEVAKAVLSKSNWAVLALTCHIELFTLAHYKHSIETDPALSPLWKDVFLHHFMEESQHAALDEIEWLRENARLSAAERDRALDELIELVGAVDGILQAQASVDSDFFIICLSRKVVEAQAAAIHALFLKAYRYQFILSGVQMTRFPEVLFGLINPAQRQRVEAALATLA
jgi:hypothetical protein